MIDQIGTRFWRLVCVPEGVRIENYVDKKWKVYETIRDPNLSKNIKGMMSKARRAESDSLRVATLHAQIVSLQARIPR